MTKYYIAQLFERNGEYEYYNTLRFKLEGRKKPETYLNNIAKSWYSGERSKQDKDDTGYYFNCGEVYVEGSDIKEISESAYNELASILTEM